MKTIINKHWKLLLIALAALIVGGGTVAYANPSFFAPQAITSVATSSPAFMTPGLATSTLVYDSYNLNGTNQPVVNDPTSAQSATLAIQLSASSTASVLTIGIERSQDGIDWYQDNLNSLATSSLSDSITIPSTFTWTFASSTIGGVSNTGNRIGKLINVSTPTRYTRFIFSLTGANGAVWAEVIPQKENKGS